MGALWSYCCPTRDTPGRQAEEITELHSLQPTVSGTEVMGSSLSRNKEQSSKSDLAMDPRCRLALQKSHPDLLRDLEVKRTLDHLYARLILTSEDTQRIERLSTDRDRRRALLTLLPERGQGAYDELLQTLSNDQSWLAHTLRQNHKTITIDELTKMEHLDPHRDLVLQEAIKRNMQDKLDEWKTALEEGVSNQEGLLPYIQQPCLLETDDSKQQSVPSNRRHTKQSVPIDTEAALLNAIELVENSRPGDRFVIYGEAGMGKTMLLKKLARSWIDEGNAKLANKFTYVFLIPLRYIGQGTLLHIICDELKLLPISCLEELEKSLHLCGHRLLFLLDSYEELREDVIKANRTDIDDLITGKLFPKSTVVVTSRPGSKLGKSEGQTTAYLQDLPENEVKPIIQHHFGRNKDAVDKVQRSFPAMAFLQKPINLALFIFIITQNKHLTLSYTQAELFSLVLQYIMLAFAKKRKLEEFTPQAGSYIANDDIHGDIRRLFSVISKTCYEQRKEINVKLQVKGTQDLKDFLDFGLFTAGPDANTVLLPHRLFIEYFAAAHLAENPDVWAALFEDIKEESERKSPGLPLPDVVRAMGLENILRFVVALSPQPQLEQVCRQVGSLFVVEREKIDDCDNYQLANFEYYSELVRDCGAKSGKRVLAIALLNAPARVRDGRDTDRGEDRSHVLLSYLDYTQRVTFLKKIFNLDLCMTGGESTLSCTGDSKRLWIGDRFVLALVYQHDCIIKADELFVRGEPRRHLDLPASVFTRMPGVRRLSLFNCTLCKGLPDYMSDINISATSLHPSPCPTNSSLERVELWDVKGLEHCDVITSRQCQLLLGDCGDVRARAVEIWFPRVSTLELSRTTVAHETEEELTSWLSTVQNVRGDLRLAPQHEGETLNLSHLLKILAGRKKLTHLNLYRYTLLLDVRNTSYNAKQTNKLDFLGLGHCKGDVDLGQLFEVCSRQCPQLDWVNVLGCQLQVNVRDTSATFKQSYKLSLSELQLGHCKRDIDLGQLLEVCSRQCPQLKDIGVYISNLVFDDEKVESVKQLPGLQLFTLQRSAIHTRAGRRLSEQEVKQLFNRLCPSAQINVDGYSESEPNSGSGTDD